MNIMYWIQNPLPYQIMYGIWAVILTFAFGNTYIVKDPNEGERRRSLFGWILMVVLPTIIITAGGFFK